MIDTPCLDSFVSRPLLPHCLSVEHSVHAVNIAFYKKTLSRILIQDNEEGDVFYKPYSRHCEESDDPSLSLSLRA